MNPAPPAGKWIDGLYGDTPSLLAARRVLHRRLRTVLGFLPLAAKSSDFNAEYVHQLRVATRRTSAALAVFGDLFTPEAVRTARRTLRRIRTAAARAREADVHAERLGLLAEDSAGNRAADAFLRAALDESRRSALEDLARAARVDEIRRFKRIRTRLMNSLQTSRFGRPFVRGTGEETPAYTLAELGATRLPALLAAVRDAGTDSLNDLAAVHELRLTGKRLRYALETFAGCFPASFRDSLYPRIEEIQERLGEINDYREIVARLEQLGSVEPAARPRRDRKRAEEPVASVQPPAPDVLEDLRGRRAHFSALCDQRHAEFLTWWGSVETRALFAEIAGLITTHCAAPRGGRSTRGAAPVALQGAAPAKGAAAAVRPEHRRVAAIDVGTNSVRLVVAESDPQAKFRIIEDYKETSRLGQGLYSTGRLDPAAVERSLAALDHMQQIVGKYQVERVRAVGTSALREAENGREFIREAWRRAGIHIEVIQADYEARLAFSSVANAFALDDRRIAAVDLGGGSTEVVLSSNGLIDAVRKLPLGAVRLTEMFGSSAEPGEYRFGEMRRAVDKIVEDLIGPPPRRLDCIIGTGGTFTSLAKMLIRRGSAHQGEGRFPFSLRGYEVSRDEVSELLELLRRTPLEKRRRVPGLSERRAEIIVAGVCVIERLMDYLRVERLLVHDGGIRDGLLTEMIDDLGVGHHRSTQATRDLLHQVRDYAERMNYERAHSEHVAKLAIRIFDQLAGQTPDSAATWARPGARELLECAGILHDVGIAIEFRRHHKHSYNMITHARLPLLSRREMELVANIARYHRKGGPRRSQPAFRRLGDDDQRLVAHLAGILRIADGLDRLHTQNVSDVAVQSEPSWVRFAVAAGQEPITNLRYARRKADVFERAFHADTRISWAGKSARPTLAGKRRAAAPTRRKPARQAAKPAKAD